MARGVQRYKNMTLARQPGELARLRVLGGPDTGSVFVVLSKRVTIGRGDENDVVLTDLKTSRKHAEITIGAAGAMSFVLRDLGSSHGVLVNGVPQKQAYLKSGDKLGVGETVLEFIGAETGATQMLVRPPSRTAPAIGTGQSGLTQFIWKPDSGQGALPGLPAQGAAHGESFLEKNKKLIIGLAVLMVLSALLPEVEQKHRSKKMQYEDPVAVEGGRSLAGVTPISADPKAIERSDAYFKEGFREYRARNFLRAQTAFETALQIYADHALANIYLKSTKKAMGDEATQHFVDAKRDEEANRFRSAQIHYESIKRLFARDQSNEQYREAETKSLELERRIREAEKH